MTNDDATLHTARLADKNRRRGARGFHVLVALEQEVPDALAPLGRLAEVKPDLLHGLEAGESSLGHGDAPKQTRTEEPRSVLWAIRRRESPLVHTRVSPRVSRRAGLTNLPIRKIGTQLTQESTQALAHRFSRAQRKSPLRPKPRAGRPSCLGAVTTHRVVAKMSNTSCTLRTRKFMTNRLLSRRQFVSARFPDSHPGGS